jgi:hypothetical protein
MTSAIIIIFFSNRLFFIFYFFNLLFALLSAPLSHDNVQVADVVFLLWRFHLGSLAAGLLVQIL